MKPRFSDAIPKLTVDRTSDVVLYRQIYDHLRRAIGDGQLRHAARLPSTRALAKRLGVSRNTVLNAYEALASEGLLAGRRGSGTKVSACASGVRRFEPPPILDPRTLLRAAHYPAGALGFDDADGNFLYLHR